MIENEISDYWRLCDELTIDQAAHLIIGVAPGEVEAMANVGAELLPKAHARYTVNLAAATQALSTSLRRGDICGAHVPLYEIDTNGNECGELPGTTDFSRSTIDRKSLIEWLSKRGVRTGYRSNASIYNLIRDGLWTQPVKIGERSSGWPDDEVRALCAARIAGKLDSEIRELVGRLHAKRAELLQAV